MKNLLVVSEQFGSLGHARDFTGRFVQTYNTEHRHSGLGIQTPEDVHFGMTGHVDDPRLAALGVAWAEHPERFGKNRWPKKILFPEAAWTEEPTKQE